MVVIVTSGEYTTECLCAKDEAKKVQEEPWELGGL
eukprot:CAMPEP_0178564046 /NCGR_PEP_ID=MMETSP0697-20121206/13415_1 /TAXON_ID=265572 /ORGANISM="Extubocellulus spinifer, Strain CCMP396" /LENGTH=34 /DNA_ID= /DNA_START= /DNA_END= /DNA_ORIENTATION=